MPVMVMPVIFCAWPMRALCRPRSAKTRKVLVMFFVVKAQQVTATVIVLDVKSCGNADFRISDLEITVIFDGVKCN